jgi:multiple sugar transport system ATP-binding protein
MSDRDHINGRDATIKIVGVGKTYPDGTRALNDVTITIEPGEFVVLVGPSGCGKSTLLRSIAGLESVTDGEIKVGDNVLNDVPPQERDLAMVFQNYALYPHLSVLDNIAFPLRMRGVSKSERRTRARETAELLELGELTERKPGALSGGQRQRVAMGRALIRNPIAFLMDEPLSNLDAKLRGEMRIEIEDLHQRTGVTFIYVTHDQTEAMTMADRVVAMQPLSPKAGRNVAQIGTPRELYAHPESSFVAGFIGSPPMNFFEAAVEVTETGPSVRVAGTSVPLPSQPADVEHVVVGFRPQAVMRKPNGETTIRLDAHAMLTEFLGSTTEIRFSADGLCAVSPSLGHSKSATGGKLFVGQIPAESGTVERGRQEFFLDPTAFHFFHPTSGSNLGGS